ncbi:MAG: SdiA-regulated domain-containing protein [Marinicella sp.]
MTGKKMDIALTLIGLFGSMVLTNVHDRTHVNLAPSFIENYQNPTTTSPLSTVANLSGITFNWIANEYITVHQNQYCRFDAQLNELFCGSLACGDCEDILFLGVNEKYYEYALVEEGGSEGSVVIVQSPIGTHNLRLDQVDVQWLTYANTAGGDAGEGVAFDPFNEKFYVCIEDPQMQVLSFDRPAHNDDLSFKDGSLVVSETLSYAQLSDLLGAGADLSSCYFNELSGHLLLMSHLAHNISEINLAGHLLGQIDLPQIQVEGFTFNHDFNQMIVVAEPNVHLIYYASDLIFRDGFE